MCPGPGGSSPGMLLPEQEQRLAAATNFFPANPPPRAQPPVSPVPRTQHPWPVAVQPPRCPSHKPTLMLPGHGLRDQGGRNCPTHSSTLVGQAEDRVPSLHPDVGKPRLGTDAMCSTQRDKSLCILPCKVRSKLAPALQPAFSSQPGRCRAHNGPSEPTVGRLTPSQRFWSCNDRTTHR